MKEKTSFSDRLRALKDAKGWSDSELARQATQASGVEVTRQSVWYALKKAKMPSVQTMVALAKALGSSVEDLTR